MVPLLTLLGGGHHDILASWTAWPCPLYPRALKRCPGWARTASTGRQGLKAQGVIRIVFIDMLSATLLILRHVARG